MCSPDLPAALADGRLLKQAVLNAIPNAQLVAISYGAHVVMVESAEHFNRIVLQFVSEDR